MGRERERRWEEALAAKRQVEEDFARFDADQGREMSAADRERIRALAADVPALWSSTTTGVADRREVVRLLVERVELTRRGETEGIGVAVHWRGGAVSRHAARPRCAGTHTWAGPPCGPASSSGAGPGSRAGRSPTP